MRQPQKIVCQIQTKYETYTLGPGLRANCQAQSNNKKNIFQEKRNMLVIAWNIKIVHNFELGQRILEFGQRDGKMYYEIQ